MRDLKRNQRRMWYAMALYTVQIRDEYGNDTLEVETVYDTPTLLHCNVSANVGQEAVEVFGVQTEYSRTVNITGLSCPLYEGGRVWFGVEPNERADNYNYTVQRVADSKNGFLVALREVTPNA